MPHSVRKSYQPRIISTLFISAAVAFLLAILVVFLPLQRKVEDFAFRSQGDATQHAARAIQLAVSTLITREWESLVGFSSFVDVGDYDSMRVLTDAAAMASEGVTWAAVVGLDGKVDAATMGVDQGADVSTSIWFNQGLRRDTLQTVTSSDTEGDSYIYMSRSVRDELGEILGLAVYRLDAAWLDRFIQESSERLGVDVTVLDQNAETLFDQGDRVGAELSTMIRSRAQLGSRFEDTVQTGRGEGIVSNVLPILAESDVPKPGWSLVVRVPVSTGNTEMGSVFSYLIWTVAGLLGAIGVLALVFAFRYLKPLADLAHEAAKIADGEPVFPSEATRTFEAEQLSNALARLQVRIQGAPETSS
ncbi:cache domain-containing protein [Maritimibacter sp. UBA3975]|uniref:cache domain-containing protein n=1 Tax=Maritimibacter sp. UBA3975 TaxID=1946833 RepID=UPI000C0B5A33|nr:cache domain-containing protein [Maritimibacter sp. UBA3975]MAM63194.1 hypothetical protein [Maritimibacter sp.]|tara:strand:+ start:10243 stop:11325 length:1083 start_codon:yes stop_codon:yes gene_type:complete